MIHEAQSEILASSRGLLGIVQVSFMGQSGAPFDTASVRTNVAAENDGGVMGHDEVQI